MTLSLSTQLRLTFGWQYENTLDLSTVADRGALALNDDLTDGTGLDQADRLWHARRTVAASGTDDLDLAGGLSDVFGQTLDLARLKGLAVRNRSATAGDELHIGGGSNPLASWLGAAGDTVRVGPGGLLVVWNPSAAGFAVTAGSADILRVSNPGGNDIDYDILVIGASA